MIFSAGDLVEVGKILKTHGYEGKLRIDLDNHIDIKEPLFLMFHQKPVPFFIQENSSRNIVSLDFVDTLEKAQELIGKTIYAPATGEEIESDQGILSYKVYDSDERLIGVIIDTIESHAQDVIVVQSDDKEVMIPFVEEFIIEFNPDKKRIIMELPEGLLDL